MCLSIPMQVVAWEGESGDLAMVEREQREAGEGNTLAVWREQVNMILIGPQPAAPGYLPRLAWPVK